MHKWLIVVSVMALAFFLILSKYEDRSVLRDLDFSTTVRVQERIDKSAHLRFASVIGNFMEGATFFASPEFTVVVTLLLTGISLYDRKKKRWNMRALIIPLALVLLVVVEVYGKSVVHHPAPPFGMIKHPTTMFPANYINEQFSYPSGHAARAVFLAVVFFSIFGVRLVRNIFWRRMSMAIVLVGYIALVSVSRIYLGHHWFSDVLGGLLLGGGLAGMTASILYTREIH